MAPLYHGGLPTVALFGCSPPPHTFVTCNPNWLPKIWLKYVVHSPDLFKDALKRSITIIPPSTTTTRHNGGLPPPLSYTLADDNPPLPSTCTQCSIQNLRGHRRFRNGEWTKWEAVQYVDKLEAKKVMEKAEWNFCKEAKKRQDALD